MTHPDTHREFERYCNWRMTKCQPRDHDDPEAKLEDIDQATHELVGEVAEMAEMVLARKIGVIVIDADRRKLLDEVGDVFFCASWCGDAWGINPLRGPDAGTPADFLADAEDADHRLFFRRLDDPRFFVPAEDVMKVQEAMQRFVLQAGIHAGILCNGFKKLRWQGREQSPAAAADHLLTVLSNAARLLSYSGQSVEQALARNIEKLDARYPEGFSATGPGGGIRTGKGA